MEFAVSARAAARDCAIATDAYATREIAVLCIN